MKRPPLIFYHKTCELFFAIAANHKSMGAAEFDLFKKLVLKEWENLNSEKYPFRNDALEKFEVVFDWFDYENLDPSECFDNFIEYKTEHESLFTPIKNQLIWNTGHVLADYFSEKNDVDRKFLIRLKPHLHLKSTD